MPMLQTPIAPAAVSPELSDRPKRRRFTVQDKLRILAETDQAAETDGVGAILRREGVYSSSLTDWRRQRDAGAFHALSPSKPGPKTATVHPLTALLAERERENAFQARRLARAEAIIDLQKNDTSLVVVSMRSTRPNLSYILTEACPKRCLMQVPSILVETESQAPAPVAG
jgi:transposase